MAAEEKKGRSRIPHSQAATRQQAENAESTHVISGKKKKRILRSRSCKPANPLPYQNYLAFPYHLYTYLVLLMSDINFILTHNTNGRWIFCTEDANTTNLNYYKNKQITKQIANTERVSSVRKEEIWRRERRNEGRRDRIEKTWIVAYSPSRPRGRGVCPLLLLPGVPWGYRTHLGHGNQHTGQIIPCGLTFWGHLATHSLPC